MPNPDGHFGVQGKLSDDGALAKPRTVPILNVAGWWDQEDFYGPIKIYELLERHDKAQRNFLVVGPWNHGGWSRGDGRKLGKIDFGSATAEHYRREILVPFLAHYLKSEGSHELPEA